MSPPRTGDQSFLGPRVPPQIEALSRGLKELDHGLVRRLLKAVVGALEGRDSRDALRAVTEDCEASEETLSHVTSGIYLLMTSAIRERDLRPEVFKEDLRDLKIPEELIADISSVVFGSRRRGALDAAASHSTPHLPTLEQLQWRVDVSISSGSLSRALQPSVLMQMKLSDGSLKQFEVPVSRFQELRYNVALILKEMNHLEKRNVLKIQD